MDKKDLILLAREMYPKLFGQAEKKMKEQIKQLKEPIRQCGGDGCVGCPECMISLPGEVNDSPDELAEVDDG